MGQNLSRNQVSPEAQTVNESVSEQPPPYSPVDPALYPALAPTAPLGRHQPQHPEGPIVRVNVYPTNVDYESKRHTVTRSITKYPGKNKFFVWKIFKPRFVVYSHREKAIYILSGSSVIRCDRKGQGKCLVDFNGLKDIALTESGHVLCIDGHYAMRLEVRGTFSRLDKCSSFIKATQICTHENQFTVLDIGNKYLAKFFDDGTFVGYFGIDQLKGVSEDSKMCTDFDGRVYVSVVEITERKNCGEELCHPCKQWTKAHIKWQINVLVFDNNGSFIRPLALKEEKTFVFKLTDDDRRCPLHGRDHRLASAHSVPNNDELLKLYSVGGMCVDANGFMTLTQPLVGRIRVYDINGGPRRCVIADPEVCEQMQNAAEEFREPRGVCLTPDRELIVCDTGKRRVQIL